MTQVCESRSCHGCCASLGRRRFLQSCGLGVAAVAAESLWPQTRGWAQTPTDEPVRVAAVFLCSMNTNEIWPYPGFDTQGRQQEVMAALRAGCPGIEFQPVTITNPADLAGATALKDQVQGYLVYLMTLDWVQTQSVVALGQLRKPMLVVDEFLGGCGAFLIACSGLPGQGVTAAAVSTTAHGRRGACGGCLRELRNPEVTAEKFAQRCEDVYRATFAPHGQLRCKDDPVQLTDIGQCVDRLRQSRFLIVGAGTGRPGSPVSGRDGAVRRFRRTAGVLRRGRS